MIDRVLWPNILLRTVLFGGGLMTLLVIYAPRTFAYSTAQIQALLPGGVSSAFTIDEGCRNSMRSKIGTGVNLRTAINNGGGYFQQSWLSDRGNPNTTSPVVVNSGQSNVPLQVNGLTFICAPLVSPDFYGAAPSQGNGAIATVVNDNSRWVTKTDAADRVPNAIGVSNMRPARTQSRSQIDHFDVLSPAGGTVSGGSGAVLNISRDNNSRYWFSSPVNIDYINPGPIVGGFDLHIRMYYRGIARYGGVEQCLNSAGVLVSGSNLNFSQCKIETSDLSVRIEPTTPITASCGLQTFSSGSSAVGVPTSFTVSAQLNSPFAPPMSSPTNPAMNVQVIDPDGVPVPVGSPVPYSETPSGSGTLVSGPITYTPTKGGTYTMSWNVIGSGSVSTINQSCPPATHSVALQPYFSATGGDVVAGAGFGNGACAENPADIKSQNRGPATFAGAGTEVGAWATGTITNFVSGMGLTGGAVSQGGHGLSFANTGASGTNYGGSFGASIPCVPDYFAKATGPAPLDNLDVGSLVASGGVQNYYHTGGGLFHLNGGVLKTGNVVNLYVDGDVLIQGDLTYDPYTLNTVPRFNLFVKGNIYIAPNVTKLHGVYIAQKNGGVGGNITTCASSPAATTETYATCNKQLHIYGSMAAEGKMIMSRTYGSLFASPGAPAEPGELFEYSPELWLFNPGTSTTEIQSYTNLPPVL